MTEAIEVMCARVLREAELVERQARAVQRWRDLMSYQERQQPGYQRTLQRYFRRQLLHIRGALKNLFVNVNTAIDWMSEDSELLALLTRNAMGAFGHGYYYGQEEALGVGIRESRGDANEPVEDIIKRVGLATLEAAFAKTALSVNAQTREQLRQLLEVAVSEGWTVNHLMGQVIERVGGDMTWRAERIARTELVRAINAGVTAAYRESGLLTNEEFRFDAKRYNAAGERIASELIEYPPAHPNCRCTVALDVKRGRLVWLVAWDELTCETCWDLETQ